MGQRFAGTNTSDNPILGRCEILLFPIRIGIEPYFYLAKNHEKYYRKICLTIKIHIFILNALF